MLGRRHCCSIQSDFSWSLGRKHASAYGPNQVRLRVGFGRRQHAAVCKDFSHQKRCVSDTRLVSDVTSPDHPRGQLPVILWFSTWRQSVALLILQQSSANRFLDIAWRGEQLHS